MITPSRIASIVMLKVEDARNATGRGEHEQEEEEYDVSHRAARPRPFRV